MTSDNKPNKIEISDFATIIATHARHYIPYEEAAIYMTVSRTLGTLVYMDVNSYPFAPFGGKVRQNLYCLLMGPSDLHKTATKNLCQDWTGKIQKRLGISEIPISYNMTSPEMLFDTVVEGKRYTSKKKKTDEVNEKTKSETDKKDFELEIEDAVKDASVDSDENLNETNNFFIGGFEGDSAMELSTSPRSYAFQMTNLLNELKGGGYIPPRFTRNSSQKPIPAGRYITFFNDVHGDIAENTEVLQEWMKKGFLRRTLIIPETYSDQPDGYRDVNESKEHGRHYINSQQMLIDYIVERGETLRGKTVRFTEKAQNKILEINANKIAERKASGVWKQNLVTNQDLIAEWAINHALMSGKFDENYLYVDLEDIEKIIVFFKSIEPQFVENVTETPENIKANKVLKNIEKYYNKQKQELVNFKPLIKSYLRRDTNLDDKPFEESIKHLIALDVIIEMQYKPIGKKAGIHIWLSKDEEFMNNFYKKQRENGKYEFPRIVT